MQHAAAIRIGGLGPLTSPGVAGAGQELLAGMEISIEDVNAAGGLCGRPLELLFEDSRGDPASGVEALERLRSRGAHLLVGEFHSVVADAVCVRADQMRFPYLCSSATLDALTERRSPYVFRLAPPQSHGWDIYARFLLEARFRQVIEIIHEDVYWKGGAHVLRRQLEPAGVEVSSVVVSADAQPASIAAQVEVLAAASSPAIALLLVGYPEPLGGIVRALADRCLLTRLSLGDPAGRAIFPDWWETAGEHGAGVSFLSYQLPGRLTQSGERMRSVFSARHGREPTFVALEGYDTVAVAAAALERAPDFDAESICASLRTVEVHGTRNVIRFSTEADGVVHQQWTWPPACVATRETSHGRLSDATILWAPRGPCAEPA